MTQVLLALSHLTIEYACMQSFPHGAPFVSLVESQRTYGVIFTLFVLYKSDPSKCTLLRFPLPATLSRICCDHSRYEGSNASLLLRHIHQLYLLISITASLSFLLLAHTLQRCYPSPPLVRHMDMTAYRPCSTNASLNHIRTSTIGRYY